MGIHTIQTVLTRTVVALLLLGASSYGKDVPIVESLSLSIVPGDKSIMEFPFKIATISTGDFLPSKGDDGIAPEIKKGENTLEISSNASGVVKTIVWGYEHPIFLDIKIEKGGDRYYRFTDPIGKNSDIKELETNTHEDVIVDLVTAAFNEIPPKGYTVKTTKNIGQSGDIKWELQLQYDGVDYSVQTWKMINMGKESVDLYEEMFVSEKNKVYGVSIEAPSLKSGEATRVFIVRKTS